MIDYTGGRTLLFGSPDSRHSQMNGRRAIVLCCWLTHIQYRSMLLVHDRNVPAAHRGVAVAQLASQRFTRSAAAPNLIDVGAVHPHMSGAHASGAQLSSLLLVRRCP